jgi:hypothetical protein
MVGCPGATFQRVVEAAAGKYCNRGLLVVIVVVSRDVVVGIRPHVSSRAGWNKAAMVHVELPYYV